MYLDILILAHLDAAPMHGYEIKKRVESSLRGEVKLNNNVLYPALRRFEELGAVVGRLEPQRGSPPRRVFSLTPAGHDVLRSMLEDFPEEQAHDDAEFLVRFAFFALLEPRARIRILARRAAALERRLAHLTAARPLAEAEARHAYAPRVMDLMRQRVRLEVDWLDEQRRGESEPRRRRIVAPVDGAAERGEGHR